MSHKELHVLPGLQAWCESNDVTILECHIRNVVLENVLFLTYSNSLNSLCNSNSMNEKCSMFCCGKLKNYFDREPSASCPNYE